jgi:hypothetical protein
MAVLELEPASVSSSAVAAPRLDRSPDSDRRAHERLTPGELDWLKSVRLKTGAPVSVIDLSAGGALIETSAALRPGSTTTMTIAGRGVLETASLRVLRCEVASLARGLVYRGGCEFDRLIAFPHLCRDEVDARASRNCSPAPVAAAAEFSDTLRAIRTDTDVKGSLSSSPVAALMGDAAAAREDSADPSNTTGLAAGWNRIVVRYLDGRLLKGFSQDFHPSRPHFHLTPFIGGTLHRPVLVPMPRLKAVFFVHDFAGDAKYVERKSFVEPLPGRRIEIRFLDDELMLGATLGYRNDGTGFFVTPADRGGNNLRVFVLPGAVRQVRYV